MNDDLCTYESLYQNQLQDAATKLQIFLVDILSDQSRVDIVSARAKTPDRFEKKARKCNDDGSLKYENPRFQIQDQIGARINVFYLSDVERITSHVREFITAIESTKKEPEKDEEFSYFGQHLILKLPEEAIPDEPDQSFPKFFELQVKTLFQHAWSEAHHDLGYKSIRDLSSVERRQIAFSSAQAWGADQVFEQLAEKLVEGFALNDNESPPLSDLPTNA